MICILCQSQDTLHSKDHSLGVISDLYRKYYNISLSNYYSVPLPESIEEWQCRTCDFIFFHPPITPTGLFYTDLSRSQHYYDPDRWDFGMALQWLRDEKKCLEVGSGAGHFLNLLRKAFPQKSIYGVDWNPESKKPGVFPSLSAAREKMSEPLDVIFAFQFLEHIDDPATFFRQCHDMLSPGGSLILSVPNEDSFVTSCTNNILNFPPHHVSRWKAVTFEKTATLFGYRVEAIAYEPLAKVHLLWYRHNEIYRKLLRRLSLSWRAIETSVGKRLLFSLAWGLANVFRANPKHLTNIRGHTLLVHLKKVD